MRQTVKLQAGINAEKAKELNKFIKGLGLKGVQSSTQGEQLQPAASATTCNRRSLRSRKPTSASRCSSNGFPRPSSRGLVSGGQRRPTVAQRLRLRSRGARGPAGGAEQLGHPTATAASGLGAQRVDDVAAVRSGRHRPGSGWRSSRGVRARRAARRRRAAWRRIRRPGTRGSG